MEMTPVMKCDMTTCAYNQRNACHTWGINVGPHAECSTFTHASARGGYNEVKGAIGACLAADCQFNNSWSAWPRTSTSPGMTGTLIARDIRPRAERIKTPYG